MTKQEYQRYQEAIERNLKGFKRVSTGACPACEDCNLPEDSKIDEIEDAETPHFSWKHCEACGSNLGGDRHPAHGLIDGKLVHLSVCSDCLYFLNYGHLDDSSMAEMEKDSQ